jgi:rod shape-determining protein MreD
VSRQRDRSGLMLASLLLALPLSVLPLPGMLADARPYWLALVLSYWLLETPHRAGLGLAFVLGLLADLVSGTLLGEQALRLCVLAFIVLRFRARLRFFPLWQQSLAMLALLLNDRVVVLMVRGFTGEGMPAWSFWLSPGVGMLLWPWVFLLLDDLRLKLRQREG